MTFNVPNVQTAIGYGLWTMPPRRCSYPMDKNCSKGDSTSEPYIPGHISYCHMHQQCIYTGQNTRLLDPLVHGNYPAIKRKIIGSRLPTFTENDLNHLKGSFDFIGLNHYCAFYIKDLPRRSDDYGSYYISDISVAGSFANGMLVREFTRLLIEQL
ncbi:hypothetical protein AQUCO_01800001v1 [Aquilegia coerulea]|uniref:Uncharacterized protein n=1 Tax=Aquilegia coerulea TaxID=218851 RepID=A0A2G5DJK1_AQUCA|nr:hypothetical protein AQUCO_01800001v1 [Aquilegia coerulea]